ncbi:MAG: hypothetical protein CVV33_04750 [Methanomicrobiales archaeon HGW-Methanomicrobiales-4]|nr:MAG: hypothetical protein CVV33_04750 [Methanomicrobiales archaeon HGW-Methanomicrobiales-4]
MIEDRSSLHTVIHNTDKRNYIIIYYSNFIPLSGFITGYEHVEVSELNENRSHNDADYNNR